MLHAAKSEGAAAGTNTTQPSGSSCNETNSAPAMATENAQEAFAAPNANKDDETTLARPTQTAKSPLADVAGVVESSPVLAASKVYLLMPVCVCVRVRVCV